MFQAEASYRRHPGAQRVHHGARVALPSGAAPRRYRTVPTHFRSPGMTIFLLASAALLLTTLAVVTWPLLRARGAGRSLRREVDVAGRQLRQLEALHAGGALTNEQFAQSRT